MARNRITALIVLGVVAVGVLALVLTRRSGMAPSGEVTKAGEERVVVELLKEPMPVADFSLTDLDGKPLSSADWKGKVVLLNFWATWCGPCRAEIPDLVALQEKYRDSLVVVGISEDEGPVDAVRKFAQEYKVNYPVAMTTPDMEKRFPGIVALPTTFILDRDGNVAQKHVGLLHAAETEAATRHLAGLAVDAEIKRVDDPSKMNAEDVAQVKEIPGVDLSAVPDDKRTAVLQALNAESCTCGCGLTVAKCRIDDPTCSVSLPLAKTIVEKTLAAH
jgi:thiol-disulfide isomerase/thioredoxin